MKRIRVLSLVILVFVSNILVSCSSFKNKVATIMIAKKIGGSAVEISKPIVIPFKLERKHIIKVSPKFNDLEVECIFDTGGMTFLDSLCAEKIGGELGEVPGEDVSLLNIEKLTLGDAEVNNFNAIIMNFKNLTKETGMIGSNFLRFFQTTINYENKIITFDNPSKLEKKTPQDHLMKMKVIVPCFPTVKVKMNGKKVNGMIDTGLDRGFVLPVEMMSDLSEKERAKCIKAKKLFGWWPFTEKRENYYYVMPEIVIGEIKLENVPVMYATLPTMNGSGKILIGKNFLQEYITILDFEHKQVLLRESRKLKRDYNFSTGIDVILFERGFVLHGLWENSSADKAGLLVDDEILKFDGFSSNEIRNSEIQERLSNPSFNKISITIERDNNQIEILINKEDLL